MFNLNLINNPGYQNPDELEKERSLHKRSNNKEIRGSGVRGKTNIINDRKIKINRKKIIFIFLTICAIFVTIDMSSEHSKIKAWLNINNNKTVVINNVSIKEVIKIAAKYEDSVILEQMYLDNENNKINFRFITDKLNFYELMDKYSSSFYDNIKGYYYNNIYYIECKAILKDSRNNTNLVSKLELKEKIINSCGGVDLDEIIDAKIDNNNLIYKISKLDDILIIITFLNSEGLIDAIHNIEIKFNSRSFKYDLIIN